MKTLNLIATLFFAMTVTGFNLALACDNGKLQAEDSYNTKAFSHDGIPLTTSGQAGRCSSTSKKNMKKIAPIAATPIEAPTKTEAVTTLGDSETLAEIKFPTNSAKIGATEMKTLESALSKIKNSNEYKEIEVVGFADERGTEDHNLTLSEKRALSVKNLLKSKVNTTIKASGAGEKMAADLSEARVVEIKAVKK